MCASRFSGGKGAKEKSPRPRKNAKGRGVWEQRRVTRTRRRMGRPSSSVVVLSTRVRPVRHAVRIGLVDRNGRHVIESVAGVVVGHLRRGGRLVRNLHHRREGALRAGRTGAVKLAERVRLLLGVAQAGSGCEDGVRQLSYGEVVRMSGPAGGSQQKKKNIRGLVGAP